MAEFSEAPSRRQRTTHSRRQRTTNSGGDDNGDRISQLPDVLLLQILSLLSTKQAVATGILSKRWRLLWPSVSLLDFDDESSSGSRGGTGFAGFVNSVLLRHDAPTVELFRLRCANPDSSGEVPTWLCHMVRRGVEHVEVLLSLSRYVALPRSLFNCGTLTVLKLDGVFLNTLSSFSVSLPAIRVLHVGDRVLFGCHDYVVKLLAGCPVLEDLVLQSTYKDACGGVFCTDGNIVLNLNHLERAKLGFSWKKRCFKSMVLVFQALYNVSYLSLSDTAVGVPQLSTLCFCSLNLKKLLYMCGFDLHVKLAGHSEFNST
ncbi:hypothetical protein Fmac_011252 [Flemingia macrophylla]|uniref:F-box domain-containing protein n=1 Tax=Flemingia macrophylla TaxID=520843 RepID=A0ABD1MLY5_9FABA